MPGLAENLLWLLCTLLECAVVVCAVKKGAFRRYLILNLYMAASVIPEIRAAFPRPTPSPTTTPAPLRSQSSSPMTLWYIALALIAAVFLGASIELIRRRRR